LLARDGIAELVRLLAPTLPDSMAVAAAGPVDISGGGGVDGGDHVPAGWTGWCPAPSAPGTGVIAAVAAPVHAGCGSGPCIVGAPPVALDTALTGASLSRLGPLTQSDLFLSADHRVSGLIAALQPRVTGGACVLGDSLNWGDPATPGSPCSRYFPVISAAPGTVIVSGTGQGLLLAAGSLELAGDAAFTGVILAAGPLIVHDQARVTGLIMAQDSLTVSGTAIVERSRCAVDRIGRGAARPGNHVTRGWLRWD
jgi:hypothetical protein